MIHDSCIKYQHDNNNGKSEGKVLGLIVIES